MLVAMGGESPTYRAGSQRTENHHGRHVRRPFSSGVTSANRVSHASFPDTFAQAERLLNTLMDRSRTADGVVLDTETISAPDGVHVIDIGAVLIRNMTPVFLYGQLIRPICDFSFSATLLSGITADMLDSQPTIDLVLPYLRESLHDLPVIGHNVAYDMGVLNREAERLGIPVLDNPTVDTMELASCRLPDVPSLSLQQIMSVLGIADREEHRALSDARQTFECLRRLSGMPGPRRIDAAEKRRLRSEATADRRRKATIFTKARYLDRSDVTPRNPQPNGPVLRSFDCGVNVNLTGDPEHQGILSRYGYDAWLWVTIRRGAIRTGSHAGEATCYVHLDGQEVGFLSAHQMMTHSGQLPADGTVMLAHIPNSSDDRNRHRCRLRIQLPEGDAENASDSDVP